MDLDIDTSVCIAGGGPAGCVLGLLLARAGVDVLVLEKHRDFLRDFRGDTIHPSTLEILDDLGLAERFLRLPHSEVREMTARFDGRPFLRASFKRLRSPFRFIAFVPQWDFLRFVVDEARRYPGFHIRMETEVVDLVHERGAVRGVRVRDANGVEQTIRARLVVGADGRDSRTRAALGLPVRRASPPIDVLWLRVPRREDEPGEGQFRATAGSLAVLLNRNDYWQIAYVIPKSEAEVDLDQLRRSLGALVPEIRDRLGAIEHAQVKRLTVRANRLLRWHAPGYLAIGDAAHAMSPIAGVGINLAIQDAVVAANNLWEPLRRGGEIPRTVLARIQRARLLPTRVVQAVQSLLQRAIVSPSLASAPRSGRAPLGTRVLRHLPFTSRLIARLVALGISRPRVRTPDAFARGANESQSRSARSPGFGRTQRTSL